MSAERLPSAELSSVSPSHARTVMRINPRFISVCVAIVEVRLLLPHACHLVPCVEIVHDSSQAPLKSSGVFARSRIIPPPSFVRG